MRHEKSNIAGSTAFNSLYGLMFRSLTITRLQTSEEQILDFYAGVLSSITNRLGQEMTAGTGSIKEAD